MKTLALIQGLYFLVTGIWPLLHSRSFQLVTGPIRDLWLIKTVGVLLSVIGLVLLYDVFRGRFVQETAFLAVGAATCLALIDIAYVVRGRIRRVYLLDAYVEIVLVGVWLSFDLMQLP
jgi:hypothetical protein